MLAENFQSNRFKTTSFFSTNKMRRWTCREVKVRRVTEREVSHSMADLENNEKPRKIADAFKELEATVNSQMPGADVEVAPFSMADLENNEKPLRKIVNAFKELEATVNSQTPDVELAPFCRACSLVVPLIGCLGIAFKFAEIDFSLKVNDLAEASKSIGTLQIMIDRDIKDNRVRKVGSHTRNLLRVKRSLDLVKAYFEQIIVTEGSILKDPASKAYAQVFAPYHGWAIRKAVAAGIYDLPTREQMISQLNEDDTMSRILMQSYITSSAPVILYIEELYHSRKLGIDW